MSVHCHYRQNTIVTYSTVETQVHVCLSNMTVTGHPILAEHQCSLIQRSVMRMTLKILVLLVKVIQKQKKSKQRLHQPLQQHCLQLQQNQVKLLWEHCNVCLSPIVRILVKIFIICRPGSIYLTSNICQVSFAVQHFMQNLWSCEFQSVYRQSSVDTFRNLL